LSVTFSEGWVDVLKRQVIYNEFANLVPENNKFYEQLLKIFKRKIKRVKKAANADRDDGDGEEEEEDDDDDLDDLDDLEDDDQEEEFCPPGCDPSLYEQVCELRERRLDQEEVLAEYQKAIEQLKKENDALVKKEKVIDAGLKAVELEIQQFQTFKQQRLNELDVVVTLRMHQVQCLVGGKLPTDLGHTIVFTNSGLTRLQVTWGGRVGG
jgi:cilia- and flagella-associated protein 44